MDEVSAKATLTAAIESPLAVKVPRSEVERALQADAEADLVLDVVRRNGKEEARRVFLALDREALEQLLTQEGEQTVAAIDPFTLQQAFDDVEAHGMREVGATLAVLVATVAGGAGTAAAAVDPGGAQAGTQAAEVGMPRAMPSDYAASEGQMPRAMPSDYAANAGQTGVEAGMPRAMPSDYAVQAGIENVRAGQEAPAATPGPTEIENVRAAQPAPEATSDPMSGIENVRAGGAAVPDPMTGIEQVRADRAPAESGGGGGTISAPSPEAGILIGGALLTIAAATFALRRKGEPRVAT
jgi:hypothetical protein